MRGNARPGDTATPISNQGTTGSCLSQDCCVLCFRIRRLRIYTEAAFTRTVIVNVARFRIFLTKSAPQATVTQKTTSGRSLPVGAHLEARHSFRVKRICLVISGVVTASLSINVAESTIFLIGERRRLSVNQTTALQRSRTKVFPIGVRIHAMFCACTCLHSLCRRLGR